MQALTRKQARFAEEYLVDLNATQAAIRAGYNPNTARSIAQENLTKPDIKAAVDAAMAERSARTRIDADRVLQEIARIAFSNIRDIFTADGRLRPVAELDADTAAAIASIDVASTEKDGEEKTVMHRIRLQGKLRALDMLMKHLGLYAPKKHDVGLTTDGLLAQLLTDLEGKTGVLPGDEGYRESGYD